MPITIQQALQLDSRQLQQQLQLEYSTARLEVQLLLQQTLQVARVYLFTYPERQLTESEQQQYQQLLQRRLAGEPLAYIVGEREFFGLSLKVNAATLIPRPDTEILVEQALLRLAAVVMPCAVLDLGTGSGAIALSLAAQQTQLSVVAVDASAAALEVAEWNRQQHQLTNVQLLQSDWFQAIPKQKFQIIVSNPPYIAEYDPHLQQGDVRFEPASALSSGVDGLDDIRLIIQQAPAWLGNKGWLLLEHGYNQAVQVRQLLSQRGFAQVYSALDLAGIERVSGGCWEYNKEPDDSKAGS